jgi:hypothetical protein
MNFESLVGCINQVQDVLQAQAAHAINLSLTARNWLVGYYIVEFEQNGEDRAKYGDKLINRLAESINRKGFEPRRLREYRQVYIVYPSLGIEIINYIQKNHITIPPIIEHSIWRLPSAKFQSIDNQEDEKWRMLADDNPPIGLLLCTDYGETTVQYATEGLSQNLFVNKYRLQLPTEEEIRQYLLDNISLDEFKKLKDA